MSRSILLTIWTIILASWVILGIYFLSQGNSVDISNDIENIIPKQTIIDEIPKVEITDEQFQNSLESAELERDKNIVIQSQTTSIYNESIEKRDPSICNVIVNLQNRDTCISKALLAKASIEKDSTICDKLTWIDQDNCNDVIYLGLAYDKKDTEICSRISNQESKNNCIARVENELFTLKSGIGNVDCSDYKSAWVLSECQAHQRIVDSKTVLSAVTKWKDPKSCNTISDSWIRSQCFDTFVIQSVKETGDISKCDTVSSGSTIDKDLV